MHIFLISGFARSGKDSTADIINNLLGGRSTKIAMADYLKYIAKKYYKWNGEKDKEGRTLLQLLGTERIREELDWQTFHAERVCQDIRIIEKDFDYIYIPDIRFRNEIHYTRAIFPYNTTTIRVNRLGFESPLTEEQKKHKSEIDLIGFKHDYELCSGDGLDNLEKEIKDVLGDLLKKLNSKAFQETYKK